MSNGNLKTKSTICSNCGGQLEVNELEESVSCPFCGTNYSVSEVLNESDAIRIEKIKLNAQQKNEEKKLEYEKEKNKNQEEKEEGTKFKKSKFSKAIMVFFVISVLFFFAGNGFFVKLLTFVQAGLFISAWLMGAKVIKEPRKGLHTILAIIAFVLIVPIISTGGGNSNDYEKLVWEDIVLSEKLPEPDLKKGKIITNDKDGVWMTLGKASKSDYRKYVEECEKFGFTVEVDKDDDSYTAYDQNGNKLELRYSEYSEEITIDLDKAMEMKENAWVENPLSKLVPEPKSKLGKVETESERYFTYYAGKTSQEEFSIYASSVLNAGFSKDYNKGEDYFYGTNADGYKVDIRYQGNNVMKISITAPDKKEETNTSTETEKVEENKTETEKPVEENKTETTKPTENTSSNNGIGKEFKEAMDSYEEFMNEYVDFMKKYSANPSDFSLLADYTSYMTKYTKCMEDFAKWEDEDLNNAEMAYYLDVQTRVNKKLLEVAM